MDGNKRNDFREAPQLISVCGETAAKKYANDATMSYIFYETAFPASPQPRRLFVVEISRKVAELKCV